MCSSRRLLRIAALLGLAVFLLGCGDGGGPTGPDSTGSGAGESGGSGAGTGGGGDSNSTVQFSSRAAPGDSARSFLRDREFDVLSVEVDYMEGYEPTAAAYDSLRTELDAHLSKSAIRFAPKRRIPAEGAGPYSADAIRDLEEQYRNHYTRMESDTLWAYFLVLDGRYTDEGVLGLAYYNTSMAFFGQTIHEISGGLTQPSRQKVEATVFRHEFGHNLGLVNNGIPTQQDHHDEANGAHCTNDQCVMYHSIETTDYFENLFDGTVPEFEAFCAEDMAAQRSP